MSFQFLWYIINWVDVPLLGVRIYGVGLWVERVRERAIRERTIYPGRGFCKVSCKCRAAFPGTFEALRRYCAGPVADAKRFGMGRRSTYALVLHTNLKEPYNARRRADISLESIHQIVLLM